ncbi:hypothetical protein LCGC14_1125080 [marine sediment metagenome]|uniref:Major capsid protein n=1 Tax=marine sediment metagenome TaxID=412755 RepID=A0A0F9Q8L7_9ZZZZ
MPTLSEYRLLATDEMLKGLFTEIITANELMPFLQFRPHSGNSMVYNRELTLPASTVHVVGDTWQDTEGTTDQKTALLTTVGNQSPLDRYASQTIGNVNSQEAVHLSRQTKSLARKIASLVITGEPENNSAEFEGLDSLVRKETRMMAMDDGNIDGPGAAETELTIDRFDAMLDMVEGGPPDIILLNKTLRRKLTTLSRNPGSGVLMNTIELFGHQIRTYNGIPLVINDYITNSEQYNDTSTWTSSTASTIFALKLGEEKEGYTIIHNGPVLDPDIQHIGIKENKNEDLWRVLVYIQAITFSTKVVAALGGIDSAA